MATRSTPDLFPQQRLHSAREQLASRDIGLEWTFEPAATQDEIARCEAELGVRIPHDLRTFLGQANGAELIERTAAGDITLTFLSCRGITRATKQTRALLVEVDRMPRDAFLTFLDYEDGDALMIDVRPNRGGVVDGWHDEVNVWHTKERLTPSFAAFVDALISAVEHGGHLKFWLDTDS